MWTKSRAERLLAEGGGTIAPPARPRLSKSAIVPSSSITSKRVRRTNDSPVIYESSDGTGRKDDIVGDEDDKKIDEEIEADEEKGDEEEKKEKKDQENQEEKKDEENQEEKKDEMEEKKDKEMERPFADEGFYFYFIYKLFGLLF